MAIGNLTLFALQNQLGLYLGLALIIIGNGFFKPNISTLVGELYEENDQNVIVHLPFSIWVLTSVHFSSTRLRIFIRKFIQNNS